MLVSNSGSTYLAFLFLPFYRGIDHRQGQRINIRTLMRGEVHKLVERRVLTEHDTGSNVTRAMPGTGCISVTSQIGCAEKDAAHMSMV